jgi:CheY-like chemotaxis protein
MAIKNVLIVEDDRTFSTVLATRCQQLHLNPRVAPNAARAVEMLYESCPDLILLDIEMPGRMGEEPSGYGLILAEKLRNTSVRDIPIIVLTGRKDPETAWHCRQAGARFIPKGPQAWATLKEVIEQIRELHANRQQESGEQQHDAEEPRQTEPSVEEVREDATAATETVSEDEPPVPAGPKILCVDDDSDFTLALGMRLRELGTFPIRGFTGTQGFEVALSERPDVIITDLHMPDGEGSYLIGRLKSHPLTREIPVIVITGQRNPGILRDIRNLGADTYLMKPIVMSSLIEELSRFVTLPNVEGERVSETGAPVP